MNTTTPTPEQPVLIGWAQADITPDQPVLIAGQFHARLSEGVQDPLSATVLALAQNDEHAVFVSCDLVSIPHCLRDAVRARLAATAPGLDPLKVLFHGTHTHTAPEVRVPEPGAGHTSTGTGVPIPEAQPIEQYNAFAADRLARAIGQAWQARRPGETLYAQGFAVVGRNRRWTDVSGKTTMYGNTNTPDFSHFEGYEDHSLNVLATREAGGRLTGLVVNVPCPSQVGEQGYQISADYWCETRRELRRRFGEHLFILAQCSAAGDQSPHLLYDKKAAARMLMLFRRTPREEIAKRIADAVEAVLPAAAAAPQVNPVLRHEVRTVELPMSELTEADARTAGDEAEKLRLQYEEEKRKLAENPALREQPRWYKPATYAFRRMRWWNGVIARYQDQLQGRATQTVELHVIRLGDVAFASNPFEYYLDFGCHIKARSPAIQTFLVQLAGPGTYVPSARSLAGGAYGSMPASNPVSAAGGRLLALESAESLRRLWPETTA